MPDGRTGALMNANAWSQAHVALPWMHSGRLRGRQGSSPPGRSGDGQEAVDVGVGGVYLMTWGTGLATFATSSMTVKVWARLAAVGSVVTT